MKCPNCLKTDISIKLNWYMSFYKCEDCKFEWEKGRDEVLE